MERARLFLQLGEYKLAMDDAQAIIDKDDLSKSTGFELKAFAMMGLGDTQDGYKMVQKHGYVGLSSKCYNKFVELQKFEKEHKMDLPETYKRWVMANPEEKRTPAYFF